jgi:hypothetical protein
MCVDYTNLIKHCPEHPFPLLRIDQVVDSMAGVFSSPFLIVTMGIIRLASRSQINRRHPSLLLSGHIATTS